MKRNPDLRVLTNSEIKCDRKCKRMHFYRYVLCAVALVHSEALRLGTLIHLGLEAWWLAMRDGRAPLAEGLRAISGAAETDDFLLAKARTMMRGYDRRWKGERFEVLGVESEFYAPMTNPSTGEVSTVWQLGGKLDAIVIDLDGKYVSPGGKAYFEHKSSGEDISSGSQYWQRLGMDSQVSTYFDGAVSLGHDVEGCIYDVIGKPGIRPLKATPRENRRYKKDGDLYAKQRDGDESVDEFEERLCRETESKLEELYIRRVVVRLDSELDEHRRDIWEHARLLHEAEQAERHMRNPDACFLYNQKCEYLDVCSGLESINNPRRFRNTGTPHAELSAPDTVTNQGDV